MIFSKGRIRHFLVFNFYVYLFTKYYQVPSHKVIYVLFFRVNTKLNFHHFAMKANLNISYYFDFLEGANQYI